MHGESHWFPVVWMLVGGAAVLGIEWLERMLSRHLREQERDVLCPVRHERMRALVVVDDRTGQPTGVRRCSAFENPESVTCAKPCLAEF